MRAERLDRAGERGHRAAEALRTDTRGIDLVEDRLLHFRVQRVGIVLAHRAQQRALGKESRLVARAAEAHADHDRRAGVGACIHTRIRNEIHDLLLCRGRGEHLHRAHVLRAKALGRDRNFDLIARHDRGIEHAGRVVVRVLAAQRVAHHGQAQIAVDIAAAHTLGHRILKRAAGEMYVLPDLGEHDRHAGVLADRHVVFARQIAVRDHLAEDLLAERRLLGLLSVHKRLPQVGGQVVVRVDAQLPHQLCHFRYVDCPHLVLLYSSAPFTKTACT